MLLQADVHVTGISVQNSCLWMSTKYPWSELGFSNPFHPWLKFSLPVRAKEYKRIWVNFRLESIVRKELSIWEWSKLSLLLLSNYAQQLRFVWHMCMCISSYLTFIGNIIFYVYWICRLINTHGVIMPSSASDQSWWGSGCITYPIQHTGQPLWSSGQNSWLQIRSSGFDSRRYQISWEVADLEWGPLSLVSKTEKVLERKSSGSGLENKEYGRRDLLRWPHGTLYPQKLAPTSPTSGGRSVGIVRSQTQATESVF
jgi:hypothetical protein